MPGSPNLSWRRGIGHTQMLVPAPLGSWRAKPPGNARLQPPDHRDNLHLTHKDHRRHHAPPPHPQQIYELQNQCSNTRKPGVQEEEWRSDSLSKERTFPGGPAKCLHRCSTAEEAPSCPQLRAVNFLSISKQTCPAPSISVKAKPAPLLPAAPSDTAGNKNPSLTQKQWPGGFCSSALRLLISSTRGPASIHPRLATLTVAKS